MAVSVEAAFLYIVKQVQCCNTKSYASFVFIFYL